MRRLCTAGLLASIFFIIAAAGLHAQAAARPLPTWQAALPLPTIPAPLSRGSRAHTKTGLLVGGVIGLAATTVFLIGFCNDPDTQCGIDEVGRAVVFIALPAAAVGALIGSLIRKEE